MGVLPAVLPHAWHVAFDVAGVQVRLVEGRIEQLDESVLAAHQAFVHCLHGLARAFDIARPGEHRPTLRNRIDLAFDVVRGAKRRAIVKVGAAIPGAVPAVLFEALAQARALGRAEFGEGGVTVPVRQRSELAQHFVEEEAEPHAFPLALDADPVHAVVPVARADQRQAVLTKAESPPDGSHAVLVQALSSKGATGQVIVGIIIWIKRATFQESDRFVQHSGVAGAQHIAAGGQGEPQIIVGAMGAHAPTGRADATSAVHRLRGTGGPRSGAVGRA